LTSIAAENIRCILLDIEGTTTSISFVYDVLFPYARQHVREFLETHLEDPGVRDTIARLREQHVADTRQNLSPPALRADIDTVIAYVNWLMDRDSKAGPLKSLQGLIWEEGYSKGEVNGHVFPDVPIAFERWRSQGKIIAIFSSGSVLAQKLLFGRTTAGDLTRFIKAYFDTTTGPKREAQSYRAIADALDLEPEEILFISDVTQELDAAAAAGMKTALSIRPGNHPQPPSNHASIVSFDELP
jgi:enolase-phosphatase E1